MSWLVDKGFEVEWGLFTSSIGSHSVKFFEDNFLDDILQAEKNGKSTYEAAMKNEKGTGWVVIFDEWKQQGILN